MVKVKTQRKQSNGPKRKAPRRKSEGVPRAIVSNPYALARLDPFNPGAKGAKVPDFDNNSSAAFSVQYETTLTVSASGVLCAAFPLWPSNVYSLASTQAHGWALTGNPFTIPEQAANFSGWNEATGLRIVGAGIRVDTNLNQNNATGKIWLSPMSVQEMAAWRGDTATRGYLEAEITRRKGTVRRALSDLAAEGGMGFISSALDPSSMHYVDPSIDILDPAFNGLTIPNNLGCLMLVTGAPANTACIDVTITMHLEFLPGKNFQYLIGPAAPCNYQLLEKVNNIAEQTPKVIERLGDIGGHIVTAVKTGLKVAATIGIL
jgi:hypothetical protein